MMLRWLFLGLFMVGSLAHADGFDNFITREGNHLKDGKKIFRFASLNAPELHRIEDDSRGICAADKRGWGQYFKWPTANEQENWIKALARTGTKATRIYVLSIEQKYDKACGRETHINKPLTNGGMPVINEKAMIVYDRMIAYATQYHLRLILPFIDHWQWWGGRQQLADFYGEDSDALYDTKSKTYAAYKYIIRKIISRKNTITGRHYYEEKAIMAWETGNELKYSTADFIHQTAAYIKALAPNQLVMDGNYLSILPYSLEDKNVDIISNHFYTVNHNNQPETIIKDLKKINGRKVYIIGEYGFKPIAGISAIMHTAVRHKENLSQASGIMIWGFRGHRHNGGFYWHSEVNGKYYSYHLPGFPEGTANEENAITQLLRNAQAEMDGLLKAPPLPRPEAPKFRSISPDRKLSWMGAPVGRAYNIERRKQGAKTWYIIGKNISDGKNKFNPETDVLFQDKDVLPAGKKYEYRLISLNESGHSKPSNTLSITIPDPENFIQTKNGQFLRHKKPYYFIGTNYWYGPLIATRNGDRDRLRKELDHLQENGVTNLRILVGSDGGRGESVVKPALQLLPGEYNKSLLEGLDYLMVEMQKRNMVAVLYLNNNWLWSGGMSQYLNWYGYGKVPNPFKAGVTWQNYLDYTAQYYKCAPCKESFNKHVKFIITRQNSLTGVPYNQDPTIMAWQLANEPRVMRSFNKKPFKTWLDATVALISRIAPYQLISTGSEGAAGSLNNINLFEANHDNPKIDYLTMHIWPKNWGWYDKNNEQQSLLDAVKKAKNYMAAHIAVAKRLNKPIVLSEFGFPRHHESLNPKSSPRLRNLFFNEMFMQVYDNQKKGGNLAGLNFWAYGGFGHTNPKSGGIWQSGDDYLGDPAQEPQGLNSVFASDTKTWSLVKSFNARLKLDTPYHLSDTHVTPEPKKISPILISPKNPFKINIIPRYAPTFPDIPLLQ